MNSALEPCETSAAASPSPVTQLAGLRTELIDLAYELECQGRPEAADVALFAAGRLADFQRSLAAAAPADEDTRVEDDPMSRRDALVR